METFLRLNRIYNMRDLIVSQKLEDKTMSNENKNVFAIVTIIVDWMELFLGLCLGAIFLGVAMYGEESIFSFGVGIGIILQSLITSVWRHQP